MTEPARKQSEFDMYHTVIRGVGRMTIFEDDHDRLSFLDTVSKTLSDLQRSAVPCDLLAWCLMSNHAHFLVHMSLPTLSTFMTRVEISHAMRFNLRHGRVGHVFQGRFASEPVQSEAQLLATVKYIHQNPWKAGITDSCNWKWSSHGEYCHGEHLVNADPVLDAIGSDDPRAELARFCSQADFGAPFLDIKDKRTRLTDEDARILAADILGEMKLLKLAELPKAERDDALRSLRRAGLSIRSIERLTGIGRNIIARA